LRDQYLLYIIVVVNGRYSAESSGFLQLLDAQVTDSGHSALRAKHYGRPEDMQSVNEAGFDELCRQLRASLTKDGVKLSFIQLMERHIHVDAPAFSLWEPCDLRAQLARALSTDARGL